MSELTREQVLMAIISGRGSAYLRGVDLSSLDLSNAGWLVEADLRHANLSNTNLSRANLKGAKLENANLSAANLSGANLEGADLRKAKLAVSNLRLTNLVGANLQSARLVGTILVKANLEGANLEDADLEGANLEGADLRNAKLNLANLKIANLQHANLQGASLLGTILDEYRSQNLSKVPMPSYGFSGSMNYVQLIDLIQFLCLSRTDLLVRIESAKGHGTIHVRSGRVYHAQTGTIQGDEAFFKMLQWENGRFETLPLPEDSTASIDKAVEHLLIESMRQRDEKRSMNRKKENVKLVQEIESYLPIPISPSEELMEFISREGKHIDLSKNLKINDVFNSKDTGEILCSINSEEEVFIAPLSYIKIEQDHPLNERIVAYQSEMNHSMMHG